jgi:pilus assembly protein Flp/PilA
MNIKKIIADFVKDEEGLTMVEYAIAGALVAAGSVLSFTTLGLNIGTQIDTLGRNVLGQQ